MTPKSTKLTSEKSWSAWLIEDSGNNGPPRYRTVEQGMVEWTTDPYKALHFCRREDAERFAQEDEDAWYIREHLFDGEIETENKDEILNGWKKYANQ